MKGMCHRLGARGGEEIGRCWGKKDAVTAASPGAPPGISRGPGWAGGWQDPGRDSCQQPLSSFSERAAVVPRLWPSTPPAGFRKGA